MPASVGRLGFHYRRLLPSQHLSGLLLVTSHQLFAVPRLLAA